MLKNTMIVMGITGWGAGAFSLGIFFGRTFERLDALKRQAFEAFSLLDSNEESISEA